MTKQSKTVLRSKEKNKHILYHIKKGENRATIVFFAGIHGNEKAGVKALDNVFSKLETATINGEIFGVLGNIKALEKNSRFIATDLNRMWTKSKIEALKHSSYLSEEQKE